MTFGRLFRPGGTPEASRGTLLAPECSEVKFRSFLWCPGYHSGGLSAPGRHPVRQLSVFFSACFFGYAPKRLPDGLLAQKGRTWIPPGGGRPSIRSRRRMFYRGRPVRQKVASETVSGDNFRGFGSILGALGENFAHFESSSGRPFSALRLRYDSSRF